MNKLTHLRFHPSRDWLGFSGLEALYWGVYAIGNYQYVYLQDKGASATLIGVVTAVVNAVSIIAVPLWGMLADKVHSTKKIFLLTMTLASLFYALIPNVLDATQMSTASILLVFALIYALRNPGNTMLDNWLVRYSHEKHLNYGSMRAIGSLGWTVVSLAIMPLVTQRGTRWTFPVCGLGMIFVFALSTVTDDVQAPPTAAKESKEKINPLMLFKNPYYTAFLPFAFFYTIVATGSSTFLSFLLVDMGVSSAYMGAMLAGVGLFEIPFLVFSAQIRKRVPLSLIPLGSTLMQGLCCLLLGTVVRSIPGVVIAMLISGVGSGISIASATNYVFTLTPPEMKSTGQSVYAAALSLAGIVGALVCGRITDAFGIVALYRVLAVCGAVATVYLPFSLHFCRQIERSRP